jgi:hypothetical protein
MESFFNPLSPVLRNFYSSAKILSFFPYKTTEMIPGQQRDALRLLLETKG